MNELHFEGKLEFISAHWDYEGEHADFFVNYYEGLEKLVDCYGINSKTEALAFINDNNTNGRAYSLMNLRRGLVIVSSKDLRVFKVYTKKEFYDGDEKEFYDVGY